MQFTNSLPHLSCEENLRPEQAQAARLAVQADKRFSVKLPTGGGKTRLASAVYLEKRRLHEVDRLLYIVPRLTQLEQFRLDAPHEFVACGMEQLPNIINISVFRGESLNLHRTNKAEIFVITIQSVREGQQVAQFLSEMMRTGKWMIAVDEYHHYGADEGEESVDPKRWSEAIDRLPHEFILFMSATPKKNSWFGQPDFSVKYRTMAEAGNLKRTQLHVYNYRLDFIVDGELLSFMLDDFYREVGSLEPGKIDEYLAEKDMRFSTKYISGLLETPIARMNNIWLTSNAMGTPMRPQMIIAAMSCEHARSVCQMLRNLPICDNLRIDWVGTGPFGRKQSENDEVMRQFCPPKDGNGERPEPQLDILVQVDYAGEGVDSKNVCEIVILRRAKMSARLLQLIGRSSRVHGQFKEAVATVNVDTLSPLRLWKEHGKESYEFENAYDFELNGEPNPSVADDELDDDYPVTPVLPDISTNLHDIELIDIDDGTLEEGKRAVRDALVASGYTTIKGNDLSSPEAEDEIQRIAIETIRRERREANERIDLQTRTERVKQHYERGLSSFVYFLSERMVARGVSKDKGLMGDIKMRANSEMKRRFGPIRMDIETLTLRYNWMRDVELGIEATGKLPLWLL